MAMQMADHAALRAVELCGSAWPPRKPLAPWRGQPGTARPLQQTQWYPLALAGQNLADSVNTDAAVTRQRFGFASLPPRRLGT
jgi:hypothetical protein